MTEDMDLVVQELLHLIMQEHLSHKCMLLVAVVVLVVEEKINQDLMHKDGV
tara:strand:- start:108 stop:260 length:153 start_codon:yes stop_codon:yes gene_type:complete